MYGERAPVFAGDYQFFSCWKENDVFCFIFFQIIEVRSQTIYESKNVFHVNEKIVFFFVLFLFLCVVVVFFNTVFS